MNTDRDNFHDWARDKPDTTFAAPLRADRHDPRHPNAVRWGRLVFLAVLGVALVVGFRMFAGL